MGNTTGRLCAGAVGRNGSGKTTLLKSLSTRFNRVLFWDWRGEYPGKVVTLHGLPDLLQQRTFRARYRPGRGDLIAEFNAVCYVLECLGRDVCFVVDEVALVTPDYKEGGIGRLLRYARPQRLSILWATQTPTRIPGVLLSESARLYVFHLHLRSHLSALATVLGPDDLARVVHLPVHQYLTVNL